MLKLSKLKNLFKKQPKKQTVTFKTSKLDFIGKTKTIDILSEQEVDKKIEQAIAQLPPGGGGQPFDPTPLQQEDQRLQQEIDKTNAKVDTNEINIDNLGSQTQQLGDMITDNTQEINTAKQNIKVLEKEDLKLNGLISANTDWVNYFRQVHPNQCYNLRFTIPMNDTLIETWGIAGGLFVAKSKPINITIPAGNMRTVYGWLCTPNEETNKTTIRATIQQATFLIWENTTNQYHCVPAIQGGANTIDIPPNGKDITVRFNRTYGITGGNLTGKTDYTVYLYMILNRIR